MRKKKIPCIKKRNVYIKAREPASIGKQGASNMATMQGRQRE